MPCIMLQNNIIRNISFQVVQVAIPTFSSIYQPNKANAKQKNPFWH